MCQGHPFLFTGVEMYFLRRLCLSSVRIMKMLSEVQMCVVFQIFFDQLSVPANYDTNCSVSATGYSPIFSNHLTLFEIKLLISVIDAV